MYIECGYRTPQITTQGGCDEHHTRRRAFWPVPYILSTMLDHLNVTDITDRTTVRNHNPWV